MAAATLVPAPVVSPGVVDETVVQLVLGLTDPAGFNREIRLPTSGEKTAFFQAQWKSIAGDNFSGFPVSVRVQQDDIVGPASNDFYLQLPITSPLNTLVIARMRDLVRCFVIQDKNINGGTCPMQFFNWLGSTAFRIDLLSGLSAVGEKEYGGASYWPNAFQPPFGATTGGPWCSNDYLNIVAPSQRAGLTTWKGFNSWRSAHGPAIGAATGRKQYYIYIDGSPWARPNFNIYREPVPPGRTGIGLCGYICQWAGAINLANDLPAPVADIGGQWLTRGYLVANHVNYDEVFYLTTGCISICVCPQLTAGSPSILPVGVFFSARVFRWNRGAEKIIFQTPVGITLANMQPSDPYLVIPISEPGEHRVEFSVWLDPADPQALTKQGSYTYSIVSNSLTEFMGHHMAPALISNNLNTLLDGQVARVNSYSASTQENIADFNAAAPAGSALNQAASSTTVKASIILGHELSIYDNTGNNNDGGSILTAQLPTGADWRDVMEPPRYADNLPSPPPAYQTPSLASLNYCDPGQNLPLLSKHPIELRITGLYKSFHPLGGRKELELTRSVFPCRVGQLRASVPSATIVSQFALDYKLDHTTRSTVTVISASPNAGWFASAAEQAAALASSSPLDYRLQVDVSGEYTTDNMWKGSSLRSSLTTWEQMEMAAYITGQLDFAAIGNDPIRTTYRRLPPALQQMLDDYMKRGIAPASFGILKKQ
jgi:hypothetical protein